MSLTDKNKPKAPEAPEIKAPERDELMTYEEARQIDLANKRQYTKERRQANKQAWLDGKEAVDSMDSEALSKWLKKEGRKQQHANRFGLHSMQINPYEYGIIQAALEQTGAKSSRELYLDYCKKLLKLKD